MDLRFECPRCGQHLSATRAQIGVTAPCPNCNAAVTVPKTSTLPHPPPAPRPTKFRERKRYETTVILSDHRAAAPAKTKKLKKWTDDFTDARNWLIHQLGAFSGDQGKEIRVQGERANRILTWEAQGAIFNKVFLKGSSPRWQRSILTKNLEPRVNIKECPLDTFPGSYPSPIPILCGSRARRGFLRHRARSRRSFKLENRSSGYAAWEIHPVMKLDIQ
jgi:hypothetical protein